MLWGPVGPASFPALLSQAAPASFLGSGWGTAPSPQPPADPAGEGILELAGLEDGPGKASPDRWRLAPDGSFLGSDPEKA